jgi:leucyl-tRNA synthetase
MKYPFKEIEKKWQRRWEEEKVHKTNLSDTDKKLYCLVMFSYPSAAKLHVGHWYNFGPTDSWARFKQMQGYNVFEPMGFDAFGLPAENYAIRTGIHPYDSTQSNIAYSRGQLKAMGAMYDWDYEVDTSSPEYYKWTQWVFLQLYKQRLAYRANAPVNWCPKDQTVLANEQVFEGECERCGTAVTKKMMTQWFFKITAYAEELLRDLEKIDWPERTKLMQRNWIGRSVGVEIKFRIEGTNQDFAVFTTRPDTLFGVTYVVLAPEHPLVKTITKPDYRKIVEEYVEGVLRENEIERTSTTKEKTGVPTGSYAVNPINDERVSIWIGDYVLYSYGTGAVMAVPGHDERDFEFAKKFDLPIRRVILQPDTNPDDELKQPYVEVGTMINSEKYNGLGSDVGIERVSDDLEARGLGKREVNYRLRDWLLSRQRYWGSPIPIIHCEKCGEVAVPEQDLPVRLPYDVDFTPKGESPLARCEEFLHAVCPNCGGDARRDADTMDTFVCSSWYFLRYPSARREDVPFDTEITKKWLPVDKYVGGAEHAVMHLLYARFVTKALRDGGWLDFDEPFLSLVHQGIITNVGAKMSKSKGNVVNPDELIEKYGADTFRMYLMFMGPYERGGDWSDHGIVGLHRFLNRVYDLVSDYRWRIEETPVVERFELQSLRSYDKSIYRKTHQTIKKVTDDVQGFQFNTAIAALMELLSEFTRFDKELEKSGEATMEVFANCIRKYIIMLAPLAPHVSEELWEMIGKRESLFVGAKWIGYDADATVAEEVTVIVQVNGKIRTKFQVPLDNDEEFLKQKALADENVGKYIQGKEIRKIVVVKNKLVNIVV